MQSLPSNCVYHEMSHPYHNVHLGNKEEFYEYFDDFLKKHKYFYLIPNSYYKRRMPIG